MCQTDLAVLRLRNSADANISRPRRRLKKLFNVLARQELALRSSTPEQIHRRDLRMSRTQFLKFFRLPGLLAEQFFNLLDPSGSGQIAQNYFIASMLTLFKGSAVQILDMVFSLFDFRQEGSVQLSDVLFLANHFPKICPQCHQAYTLS